MFSSIIPKLWRRFNRKRDQARPVIGMARGTVVVDENVRELIQALKLSNLHVFTPPQGMKDEDLAPWVAGRILITKNPKDFIEYAPVYDFGIIALDKLKFIDPSPDNATNRTVRLINKALSQLNLFSRRTSFYCTLYDQRNAEVEDLR
jgi:hypothetical protein